MDLATPQDVAKLIQRDKDALITEWEAQARKFPGSRKLDREALLDHLPQLLDELTRVLGRTDSSTRLLDAFCAHGAHRLTQGISIAQVVDEYRLLRTCLVRHIERSGQYVVGDTSHEINETIDEGIKAAIETYIERRNHDERKRREEYLTFIVHDLRSPLSAIYYAILLVEHELEKTQASERMRSIHAAIKRNIVQMQSLIVKLLQEEENIRLGNDIQVRREYVEVRPIAEFAIRTLAPIAEGAGTQVQNQIPQDLRMHADADLIERVFQNLITNSIEHTPRGTVTVGASNSGNGDVQCWVADNGAGVADALKGKVFEKFQSTGGIGLGLAVVERLVKAHGGSVELNSEIGKGTTVRFTIPA